jgi:hypothetical protein
MAVVLRIYERLDIRLTNAAVERMQRLALSRSRYERSGASPTSPDLGLDCSAEMQRFEGLLFSIRDSASTTSCCGAFRAYGPAESPPCLPLSLKPSHNRFRSTSLSVISSFVRS